MGRAADGGGASPTASALRTTYSAARDTGIHLKPAYALKVSAFDRCAGRARRKLVAAATTDRYRGALAQSAARVGS